MRYAVAGVALGASLLAGCAQPPAQSQAAAKPDESSIRAAVEARLKEIGDALGKKDASTIAGMFTEDATWILPDASTFKGRDAIQKGGAAFFASFDSTTNLSEGIDKLVVVSDSEAVTFATGKYTIYMKGKKTGEAHVNPFADHWKKGADGVWRITYEINAEGPATPPAPAAAPKKS
jgi:uncharacterized protein (TIGR02246 family)